MLQLSGRLTEIPFQAEHVQNRFLQSLTAGEFDELRPFLRPVSLKKRAVVHQENKPIEALYFIESGVVSRLARTQIDGPVEIAMVGNTGFIGLAVVLGTLIALHRTMVLIPGTALRISAQDLQDVMARAPSIRETLLRYAQLLMMQNAQISLCNARHSVETRLARWLLLAQDRVGDTLPVTHELLAMLLGVRRSGISTVVQTFECLGLVKTSRGTINIHDREALLQRSCECYRLIEERSFWHRMPALHRHAFRAE